MKWTTLLLLSVLLAGGLVACSDDDPVSGGVDTTQAVHFTQENAQSVASEVAGALDLFPGLNGVFLIAQDAAESYGFFEGETMPAEGYDLGNLPICGSGRADGTWMDADDNQLLSAGDKVTLDFDNCNGELDGEISFDFNAVAFELTDVDVGIDLAFTTTIGDTFEVETVLGNFDLEVIRISEPAEGVVLTHKVDNPADGGAGVTMALDGETTCRFGCFNLYYSLNPETGGFVLSEPYGVFRIPAYGVATLDSGGLVALDYANGAFPSRGQMRLYAEARVAPCTGVDVPGGGVTANGSNMSVTIFNGGQVTLSGEDSSGELYLVNTHWALFD